MPSTYTVNAQLQKVAYDEQAEVWGDSENQNWDRIDRLTSGRLVFDVTGLGATYSLTDAPGMVDQASNLYYIFYGTLSQNLTVTIPARSRAQFYATDQTTPSNYSITIAIDGASGTTSKVTIPRGPIFGLTVGVNEPRNQGPALGPIPTGFMDAIFISPFVAGADAATYFFAGNRKWVSYVEGASGRWRLVEQVGPREVINADPSDGSVAFPSGTIKSFGPSSAPASDAWNIGPGLMQIRRWNAPVNTPFLHFMNNGAIPGGVVLAAGGGVSYVSNSDYRLKVSYGPFSAWSLPDLPVHDAAWKADPEARYPMFLAHEVAEARPWAVSGEKDAVDEDGNIKPQGVDASKLIPEMWAMIQSLRSRVSSLEGRLASCLSLR